MGPPGDIPVDSAIFVSMSQLEVYRNLEDSARAIIRPMTTLLEARDRARRDRRLSAYRDTRAALRQALAALVPGQRVIVFGSLTRPGAFNDMSDVDLALDREPAHITSGVLMGELMERLGRPVDLVQLDRCRFRDRIIAEGEEWIC